MSKKELQYLLNQIGVKLNTATSSEQAAAMGKTDFFSIEQHNKKYKLLLVEATPLTIPLTYAEFINLLKGISIGVDLAKPESEEGDIMKVLDIPSGLVSDRLISWLDDTENFTYKDMSLKEHLYDVNGILENTPENEIPSYLLEELNNLSELTRKRETGYIRITYS